MDHLAQYFFDQAAARFSEWGANDERGAALWDAAAHIQDLAEF